MTRSASILFRALALCAAVLAASMANAAPDADSPPEASLDALRTRIDALHKNLNDGLEDSEFARLRGEAAASQAQADAAAGSLAPQLASVQARLTELGTLAPGTKEDPDIARQRAQLVASQRDLDAQLKLAKLLSLEASQAARQIVATRRSQFQARLGERTPSILAKPFWSDLAEDAPRDLSALAPLGNELRAAVAATPGWVWAGVLAVMALLIAIRLWATRRIVALTSTRVPAGRLRRSLHALAVVTLAVLVPGLMAEAVYLGVNWDSRLSTAAQGLLGGLVGAVFFGGYVAGLGGALLAAHRPSWRLPPLQDDVALSLRWFPSCLAVLIVASWQAERLATLVNAGLSTAVAINCITALATGALLALALMRAMRLRRLALIERRAADPAAGSLWVAAGAAIVWLVLIGSLVGLLTGYVAFGGFIVKQVAWALILFCSAYLINVLIDDAVMSMLGVPRAQHHDDADETASGLRAQAAVLISGVARLLVALTAITLLLAPFGEGPSDLFRRAGHWQDGVAIGEVLLRPVAVAQGIVVLALSLLGVRLLKGWLGDRFLPTTTLDPGMRVSATTLFGYAGGVFAVALSLSALGIGLERIAWVASALSVGIGFGLQAVVQNFVSGLILLAERPVKVGDWVALGGVEGDIRRISVRATEIQMSDRSTVIVPNSEFITKTVRNVTLSNPLGVVTIKLPMPLDADAQRVRDVMLATFTDHVDVLETPAPSVSLEGIDANQLMMFSGSGYVNSPRAAYGVRSALLFEVLRRLREAGITMAKPPMLLMSVPAAAEPPAERAAPAAPAA